jgi:GNAT superfamily N-acetyltransferase
MRRARSRRASSVERRQESQRPADAWDADATARSSGNESASFVAEAERGVVGLVGAHRNRDEPATVELVSMWVAPGSRGHGLGARLVELVIEWAREGGAQRVALWVVRGNRPAIALYERAGFVTADRPSSLAAHPCHEELRMVRELVPDGKAPTG